MLLGLPEVRWQAIAGLAAQVIQGAVSVGIILVFREYGRSLALAGAVLAAFWVAGGVARPVQGRLIDSRGPRQLMAACGIASGACLAAVVGLCSASGPGWSLIALGLLAGLGLPPVSTSMRVTWAARAGGEPTAAYSLVYLIQELAILTGPLLFAALVAAATPSVALLSSGGVRAIGSLGFAASLSAARVEPSAVRHGALRIARMRVLLLIAMLLGAMIGAIQIAAPTFAVAHHAKAAAGVLIALVSIGGIIGAAVYGSRDWRSPAAARLVVLLVWMTATVAVAQVAGTVFVLGDFLLVAGLPLNPALTTLSLLVDQHVPANAAGEAFGWLSTGLAGGTGAASAIAAGLAQHQHGAGPALTVAAVAGGAACVAALAALGHLRAR